MVTRIDPRLGLLSGAECLFDIVGFHADLFT